VPEKLDLESQIMAQGTESGTGGQAANGKPEDPRSESVRRSSRLSILTPERLLEGLRTFPSRDNGDSKVTVPGHMTWDALMKIGLVYSFVGLVKKVDAILRKIILFNLLYTGILGIFKATVFGIAFIFKSIYRTFNLVVQLVPIKAFRDLINKVQSGILRFLNKQDTYIAYRIKEYLWTHPRAQETLCELVDDFMHWLLRSSCEKAHPNSNLSRAQQIDKAFEGLNKKSFEVETN